MAEALDVDNILRDATDCEIFYSALRIRLARTREQSDPEECRSIEFGNNSSEWARDDECDDPRFIGPGMSDILLLEDTKADAEDCRKLCRAGEVWLR